MRNSYGVTGYDPETCWRDYPLGMPQTLPFSALGFAVRTPASGVAFQARRAASCTNCMREVSPSLA
jgi:hypothetical protein